MYIYIYIYVYVTIYRFPAFLYPKTKNGICNVHRQRDQIYIFIKGAPTAL